MKKIHLRTGLILIAIILIGFALTTCKKDPKDPETKPIPETTKVIDESTWQANVISVDSANYTFSFNENISNKVALKTGDILVSTTGEGYLRKVINVVQENGEIKIYTEFASLNEAVRDGSFSFSTLLSEQNIKKITYFKKGIKIDTAHMKSTEATNIEASIDEYLDNDQKIHVTGNFSMLPSINCELVLGLFKVKKFSIDYEIEEQINLATTLEILNLEYSKEVELVNITFNTIIVYIGVMPVVIVPEMVIVAGVNMNIESNISTSIHQQMNYSVGVLYENETWTPTQENTKSFTYQPPTLSADANAKAYIKPQLNFKVYGTVSPSIYGEAYGRIEADLLENPWWAIYGGANVGLGVKMKIWNQELFDWPETPFYIFDYEQLIAQSTNPPVDLPIVTTAEITSIGQSIATGGGNVTDQGGSIVSVRGVCWSTSQNPSLTDSHVTSGNGTGVFICNITGLSANTTYYVRAYAMNTDGVGYGNQVQFTTIGEGQIPTIITNSITNIGQTTATGGGNVTTQGSTTVTARGVCWSASQNPTITNSHTNNGSGEGTFTSNITGLSVSTTYYVRAYATNSAGTAYGDQESFTTSGNGTLPTITTNSITNITETSATGGGNVTSGGNTSVTERGVCWSTSQNPTVTNSHTSNGSGEGTFTSNITGLSVSTTYYVRAYATNSAGTAYGDQESFTTTGSGSAPTVTTASITNITETSATGGGNVTSDGGTTIAARGVCWSTSQNPTITDEITINGGGTGSFTSNLTGLAANTAYYVRAYATNIAGTAYGDQESFTTTGSGTFPIVATISISSISRSTAIGGGEVINEGSEEVTERGVCWSTHIQPSISDQRSIDGNGIGIYLSHITGLSSSTMYYVRAYAINNFGTSYGEQLSFTTSDQGQETVTDIDGNIYSTLIIGSRQWMGEDLKVTHYNNGDDIPNITDGNQWYNQNSGAYCWYNNNENLYFNTYGALYNWFVTIDERKVCPIGWVVPDITDWQEIFIALEQENVGGKLKETGTTHWLSPNTDATNETNFTILPAGYRLPNGEFNSMGYGNSYWYTDEARPISASNSSGNFVIIAGNSQPKMGVSLRCIKTR